MEKTFHNGFQSWIETYHEITVALVAHYHHDYHVAERLTDEFEMINKGRDWECWNAVSSYIDQSEAAIKKATE